MEYKPITCDSLIKKITKPDMLFNGKYCTDLFQNCEFGCLYCDSSFDKTIYVKMNATEIFEKELEQLERGVIIIGSAHDPYQKAEEKFEVTKNLLRAINKHHFPCHILTKSSLVLRDIDLLSDMQCVVTISITSLDKNVSQIFEENVPSPKERLQAVETLMEYGIETGLALMPVLPFIVEPELEDVVKAAKRANARYLLHKHLELKGDLKRVFKNIIQNHYPHLLSKYDELYKEDLKPNEKYIAELDKRMHKFCKKYNIPKRILLQNLS